MLRRHALTLAALSPLLACDGRPRSEGADVAQWIRYAGRILAMGDSITIGHNGLVGGWRVGLSSALTAAGVGHTFVGPYSDAYGAHRGVSGTAACLQTSAVQTDCATYGPRLILLNYGVNDIGGSADGGQERTAAQTITAMGGVIDWCQAGAPGAIILVGSIVVPQSPAFASYWARRAIHEEYNSLLPALCDSKGVVFDDAGAPETTDGVHLSATGYGVRAASIAARLLQFVPGA